MSPRSPIVGIPCDHRMVGPHPFHMVGEKYIVAVRDGARATPFLIPVLDPAIPTGDILAGVRVLDLCGYLVPEGSGNLLRMRGYLGQRLLSVKMLAPGDEPDLQLR